MYYSINQLLTAQNMPCRGYFSHFSITRFWFTVSCSALRPTDSKPCFGFAKVAFLQRETDLFAL